MKLSEMVCAGLVVFILIISGLIGVNAQSGPEVLKQPFDHSQCQYPDRTTNPPNGCDNSDPCDPAEVKGGSGDCKDNAKDDHAPIVAPQAELEPVEDYYVGGK